MVVTTTQASWQGVAAEDMEQVSADVGLRLARRSRRLLAGLIRPVRATLTLAAVAVVVSELAYLAGPLLVAYGIDTAVPALTRHDGGPLIFTVLGYLVAAGVNAVGKAAFVKLMAKASQSVLYELREQVFDHAQRLSLSFHERYTSGRVIARLTSDLETLGELTEEGLIGLLSGVLSVLITVVAILVLDWSLGLIALLSFLPIAVLTRRFQTRSTVIYRRSRSAIAALIVQFTETMNGLRAVLTFRREARNETIFDGFNQSNAEANVDIFRSVAHYTPAVRMVGNVSLTVVMIAGAAQVITGHAEIGVLAAFLLYVRRMYDPLDELAMFYNSYQSAAAALEKLSGLLEEEPSVPEPDAPEPLAAAPAGAVRFHRVSFGYHSDRPVLPPFDLDIPAGQTVALVGATGAGKSTLAKVLARFYDPTTGRVTLDGSDVSRLALPDLRRGIVMVTQESFLFSGSVADNIALGEPTATRAEIEAAADAIGAGPFIRALPQGFDTDVRKRGGRLSAGQRQLVAFARAFLANPAVLILDEATASLDISSERAVQRALGTVLHGRTALIIAHRLSTVAIADRVLVVDAGRIVEDGSPADLLTEGGAFAALHSAWRDSLV